MIDALKETGSDVYVLETGDCGAARLQMQDEIYGASTRQMMLDSGPACAPGCGSSISHAARESCRTGLRCRWDRRGRWLGAISVETNWRMQGHRVRTVK